MAATFKDNFTFPVNVCDAKNAVIGAHTRLDTTLSESANLKVASPKLNPIKVFGLFNPWKYHTKYDEWLPKYNVDVAVL